MMTHSSLALPIRARWFFPTVFAVIVSVCTPAATTLVAQSASKQDTASAQVSDIPHLPDVVTAVSFQLDDNDHIMVQAEIDGQGGTFIFDTGSPTVMLSNAYQWPSANIDTVPPGGMRQPDGVLIHTMRMGTLLQRLPAPAVGSPQQFHFNAAIKDAELFSGSLGTLGLNAMEPFEIIIDYTHKRFILIRLDSAGRRLANVPAFTPRTTVRLVPARIAEGTRPQHWGVEGQIGKKLDTLLIDTGNGVNQLTENTRGEIGQHLVSAGQDPMFGVPRWTLDSLVIAGQSLKALLFDQGDYDRTGDMLGPPFLEQFGVVGFNLRRRQFILYNNRPHTP